MKRKVSIAKGKGSASISDVAFAAVAGGVDILLIEANRLIPGKISNESGSIDKGDLQNPEMDDLLDDLGELVTRMGGKV